MLDLPPPLTPEEAGRLHAWERFLGRFYSAAIVGLIAATAIGLLFGEHAWLRRSLLVGLVALVVTATVIQRRVACPRCRRRLGFPSRMRFPDFCPACRVPFPRPEA